MNRDKIMTFVKKSLRFLPDKSYIKLYYRLRVGRKLNTNNPTTLNEKLQWLKFNYRFKLYDFENIQVYGMKDADTYLSIVYGDYMKLPPEDQRINHGIKAWRELPNEK